MGAHPEDRLALTEPQHAGKDFGPTSKAVLGPEASRITGVEPDQDHQDRATGTELLQRQRILLGRRYSLCAAHAVEGHASLSFLEWPGVENRSQPRRHVARRTTIASTNPILLAHEALSAAVVEHDCRKREPPGTGRRA